MSNYIFYKIKINELNDIDIFPIRISYIIVLQENSWNKIYTLKKVDKEYSERKLEFLSKIHNILNKQLMLCYHSLCSKYYIKRTNILIYFNHALLCYIKSGKTYPKELFSIGIESLKIDKYFMKDILHFRNIYDFKEGSMSSLMCITYLIKKILH